MTTAFATEVDFDPELGSIVNESDIPTAEVFAELERAEPLIASMVRWTMGTQQTSNPRQGNLFDRNKYVMPAGTIDQMRIADFAVEHDDVVGGIADSTEALAINAISFWDEDGDEQDVWNQIAADIDLDARLKEMWRDDLTYSQFYVGIYWGTKSYKVRGKSKDGTKRKKEFKDLKVPLAVTLLDPLKIAPLGMTIFNKEKLVWCADRAESNDIDLVLAGKKDDPILRAMVAGEYQATKEEKVWLQDEGYKFDRLFLLNPIAVFRHTQTRPAYRRLAAVRMKSVFGLLDRKDYLGQMDRAHLIGGTNFIVLIKKGTDQFPAKPQEIAHLEAQVRMVARVPVIVGDHRLSVEIVTPKLDTTLDGKRYATLNSAITARLYGMFVLGANATGAGTGADKSDDLTKVVARGMESKRKMILRTLERHLFKQIFDLNEQFTGRAKLKFHPNQIALGFDNAWASFLLELRASNEISRETILSQFDLDQADEALMLKREADVYDDIFQTQVPFAAPNPKGDPAVQPSGPGGAPADTTNNTTKRRAGRNGGGTRNGGGAAPGSGQGQDPVRPRRTSK